MNNKIEDFVLIIGAMKSGTTSLYEYLTQHPQIASPQKKELHFFSSKQNFSKGYNYYLNCWHWNDNCHKYALESTPAYTRCTHSEKMNAAANIAQMKKDLGVNFKFIYIMRNPIDRIESHYNHALVWEEEKIDWKETIDLDAIDTSKYAMQIQEYYNRFPESDILLLNFEDLKQNPENTLRKICSFVGIDINYKFESLTKVHNLRGSRKVIFIPGWYKLKQTSLFSLVSFAMPSWLKIAFRAVFKRKRKAKTNLKLSDTQKQYALKKLKRDLRELKERYQIDISSWGL